MWINFRFSHEKARKNNLKFFDTHTLSYKRSFDKRITDGYFLHAQYARNRCSWKHIAPTCNLETTERNCLFTLTRDLNKSQNQSVIVNMQRRLRWGKCDIFNFIRRLGGRGCYVEWWHYSATQFYWSLSIQHHLAMIFFLELKIQYYDIRIFTWIIRWRGGKRVYAGLGINKLNFSVCLN